MLIADSLRRQDGSPSGLNVTAVFNQSCVLGTVVCCSNFRHLANEAEVTSSLLLVGSNSRYPQRHHWRKGAGWEKKPWGSFPSLPFPTPFLANLSTDLSSLLLLYLQKRMFETRLPRIRERPKAIFLIEVSRIPITEISTFFIHGSRAGDKIQCL